MRSRSDVPKGYGRMGFSPAVQEPTIPLFRIAGVGASAGGLEAFTELLRHLPPDTGMAFVLVQHLDPTHESMLPGLLAPKTAMAVVEAAEDMVVAPNTVYVIPAKRDVTIEQGVLRLSPRPSSGQHLPIDSFLLSLSRDRGSQAVAVVLSGTAADGAAGIQAIKAEGGTTLAQDPGTAKYRGMPENAIATGEVDYVLPIPLLAKQLSDIAGHPGPAALDSQAQPTKSLPLDDPILADLLTLVHSATKADFSHYKQSTVMRRIGRRMAMRRAGDLEGYLELLHDDPVEVEALYQDLLIRVTSFFRQPQVFETLKRDVFPLIAEARAGGQVRFWVPGCASGEEAYSLAMAWAEFQGADQSDKTQLQVFASDINQQVIDKARLAIYPESITADVTPERLARFFSRVDAGFQIDKGLRDICVFAKHDLTRDPPYSKLDLISLRNVLIYLGPLLQRRVMPLMHFALRPAGFLVLGESESIGGSTDLFSLVDKKAKIYRARPGDLGPVPLSLPPRPNKDAPTAPPTAPAVDFDPSTEADRIVLDGYAPAGVIVDADLQIRRFRGHTGAYLEPGPGRVSYDLLRMAREGLAGELKSALGEARRGGTTVRRRGVRILRDARVAVVGFDVIPMGSPSGEDSFLVLFHDLVSGGAALSATRPVAAADEVSTLTTELEQELSEMREYARAALEDRESANEELRSANEELLSTNEELQSVNEELETASEEVQSANEELRTLNEELQTVNNRLADLNEQLTNRNAELRNLNTALDAREIEVRSARDYALAVVDTVREPLLVLDPDFRVVSASPPFYSMFETSAPQTLGQSFFELKDGYWEVPELRAAVRRAFVDGLDFQDLVVDREVSRRGRRTMVLSGRRIHSLRPGLTNVLVAIDDVTQRAQADALSESLDQINFIMISTVDYDELLASAMAEAAQALRCDEAVLAVFAEGSWVTRFSAGAPWANLDAALPEERARQFSALSVGQRAIVSRSSLEGRTGPSSRHAGEQTIHVPLRSQDKVVGAFSFGRSEDWGRFTSAELDFIDKLAPALSMALKNAELHANARMIAEVLQTSLLKPVKAVPGLEIGLAYQPAHLAERVGGDFYDVFALKDARVAVLVGDVCGSGVQAASLTETVRATLRALASFDASPSSILTGANEVMLAHASSLQMVTVLLAILDIPRGTITVSSAGHPPPVLCGETCRFLEAPPGLPLGTMSHAYREAEFDVLPAETIFLYTDGLTEARRGSDFFGEARLVKALSAQNLAAVQRMVDTVVSIVRGHADGLLTDDLAVLAVRLSRRSASSARGLGFESGSTGDS
jgi:two-component system CheB/CheR fusion protein